MSRISLPDLDQLTPAQQAVAREVAQGPRGTVRGPVRLWLHSPELAARAQKLGEFLRWGTVFEPRLSELTILITARHYDCHYVWFNHVALAEQAGLSTEVIEAIKHCRPPPFVRDDEAAVHAFVSEMLRQHTVTDATLEAVKSRWGERGAVELGAIIGHYHLGAIVLATAQIDLPDGSKTCLPA